MLKRCECPTTRVPGVTDALFFRSSDPMLTHKANECPGTENLKLYTRDGKRIWLCSGCQSTSDVVVVGGSI